jgi:hypothetical protein
VPPVLPDPRRALRRGAAERGMSFKPDSTLDSVVFSTGTYSYRSMRQQLTYRD